MVMVAGPVAGVMAGRGTSSPFLLPTEAREGRGVAGQHSALPAPLLAVGMRLRLLGRLLVLAHLALLSLLAHIVGWLLLRRVFWHQGRRGWRAGNRLCRRLSWRRRGRHLVLLLAVAPPYVPAFPFAVRQAE